MWTDDDMFPCSTQTTKFSVDFESIKEKKITCSQGVAGCIEILDYIRHSLILPMCYEHKKHILAFLLNLHKVLQRITHFFTGKFHMLLELENLELKTLYL